MHPPLMIPPPTVPEVPKKVSTVGSGVDKPITKLTWNVNPGLLTAFKPGTLLTVTGQNTTAAPLGFGYIRLKFSSASEGPNLFRENKIGSVASPLFKPKPKKPVKPTDESDPGPATEKPDEERPEASTIKPLKGEKGFIVDPGQSVVFTFQMETGAPNTYTVLLTESWRRPDDLSQFLPSGPTGSDDMELPIILKPT